MNTVTKNLEKDHENILRLIDVMEKMIQTNSKDIGHFEKVVDLIRNYADAYHHAKEETLLFPMMVSKGFSNEQGPVAVMLHDHVEGRNYVKGMADGIAAYKTDDEAALSVVYQNTQGYIDLLRAHISKENKVLFRMADNILSESDQEHLLSLFAEVEKGNHCGGDLQDCLSAISKLEAAYN